MIRQFIAHPLRGEDTEEAFKKVFVEVQEKITKVGGSKNGKKGSQAWANTGEKSEFDAWDSGSTCTMVYLDIPKCTITFAHVGDARSCLGKRKAGEKEFIAEDMTVDH